VKVDPIALKFQLTAAQTTSFSEDTDQMELSRHTWVYLQTEGIDSPGDVAGFTKKDTWDQSVGNCKCQARIRYPANAGQMIAQAAF
jgi:hypothetical protein